MIRLLVREALFTVVLLLVVSVVGFVLLDRTGVHDWWGTLDAATRAGVSRDDALVRSLPTVWNPRVADARVRTLDDLADLAAGTPLQQAAARQRLEQRGTAALPTMLAQLRTLPPAAQRAALEVLAQRAPALTDGERPPVDPPGALAFWDRFEALRGLDFRAAYARRLVARLVEHESRNAAEEITRLGTFAFPAIFEVLEAPVDADGARRLTGVLADTTGRPLRVAPGATVAQTRAIVDAWRAWWFAEKLEYDSMGGVDDELGHVTETRYGRWLDAAFAGRLGNSRVTHRPIQLELRERLPRSTFAGGLSGLLAVVLVVAFGGGAAQRGRGTRVTVVDFVGSLVPGLIAFVAGFLALTAACAAPARVGPLVGEVLLAQPARLLVALVLETAIAVVWLRRRRARVLLRAVRREAESWAVERRHPRLGQLLRHGLRVGAASLLAPLGYSAMMAAAITGVVEPLVGLRGMGALTFASVWARDAPWLLVALVTLVPLWQGGRWARLVLIWALGDPAPPGTRDTRESVAVAAPEAPPAAGSHP